MDTVIYYVLEYFLCVADMLILYSYFFKLYNKRTYRRIIEAVLFLGSSLLILSKGFLGIGTIAGVCLVFCGVVFYVKVQFEVDCIRAAVSFIIYTMCLTMCELVVTKVYEYFIGPSKIACAAEFHALRYNIAIISKVCLYAVLTLLTRKKIISTKEEAPFETISSRVLKIPIIMFGVSLLVLHTIITSNLWLKENTKVNTILCLLCICIFAINIVMDWSINFISMNMQKQKEYELIQYQNELLVQSIENNQVVEEEWRRIRHDFNNHISCVDMLLQMGNIEKARNYIQKLTKLTEIQMMNVTKGNTIAEAVIHQKRLRAKQYNIEIEEIGELPAELEMEDVDLCALLSNGLDNAIEATSQIEDGEKRKIIIKVIEREQHIELEISNPIKENIQTGKILVTTKEDTKMHGIGMHSMNKTVEKYKGRLNWQCEDKEFTLRVVLPI